MMGWFLEGLRFLAAAFVMLTVISLVGAGLGCLWKEWNDE